MSDFVRVGEEVMCCVLVECGAAGITSVSSVRPNLGHHVSSSGPSDHEKMIPVPQFGMMFEFPVGGISGWVRGYAMKAPVEGALSLKIYRFDMISSKL